MIFENFIKTTLQAPVDIGADTISISAAAAPFNTPVNPEGAICYLTLVDSLTNPTKVEIISYTGRTGTGPYTLTGVLKGRNGTSDVGWSAGDIVIQDVIALFLNSLAMLNAVQSWSAPQRASAVTDNDGSFDMSAGNDFVWSPTADDQLSFTNLASGQRGMILLDNSAGYTITLDTMIEGPSGLATALTAAGKNNIAYWCYDGTNVAVTASEALS